MEAERGSPSLTRTTQAKKIMDILHWSTHEDKLKVRYYIRLRDVILVTRQKYAEVRLYPPLLLTPLLLEAPKLSPEVTAGPTFGLSQIKRCDRGFDIVIIYLNNVTIFSPSAFPQAAEMLSKILVD